MAKFLVMYHSPMSAAQQMASGTPEQAQAGMDAWMAWANKAGSAIVDLGTPLGNAQTVDKSGSKGSSSTAGGYSLLQADSMNAVRELLKEHPHLMVPGNTIEVHEALPMPGM